MFLEHIVPYFEVVKGRFLADIIDHNGTIGIFHVIRNEASKAFLASCIPELHSILMSIPGDILNVKIDADSRLHREYIYIGPLLKLIFNIFFNDGRFADRLIPQKNDLIFSTTSSNSTR